ncbi:hypothetical protein [Spirillospora sp. CA-128828]|uniref:hypothetical protein n=1 Tax=Spirillospora sp. CA-128828 TaxID=3240033 RepID=UPI003D8AE033
MSAVGHERREQVWTQLGNGSARSAKVWIAADLRVGLRLVQKWRRAWRGGGAEALWSKGSHRRPRLDDAAFARSGPR